MLYGSSGLREHSALETQLPRVCCPRVRLDPTASLHGLHALALHRLPVFALLEPLLKSHECSRIQTSRQIFITIRICCRGEDLLRRGVEEEEGAERRAPPG